MERAAHAATVVAALIAIFALTFGLWQFNQTQTLTRENLRLQKETLGYERDSKAVELFLKFNELQKDISSHLLPKKGEASFWHHNMLLALTETVYKLTEGDPGWRETVIFMLQTEKPFLDGVEQNCRTFYGPFVELMKSIAPAMKCS